MATLDVKFTKFDNRPWGFRLAGGSDFPEPLTVIRVTEGSLAECMGLKAGDVIVKLNDQPISELTHGQAHEALCLAGNNFVLGVRRAEDLSKLLEGIEEKIEPYMLPIENILFDPIERETTPDEVPQIEDESVAPGEEEQKVDVEIYPEKPRDENSEKIANPNLTEEEIAELITNEEEVIDRQKGVLGVNFHKIRPRAPLFKQSKVFAEVVKEESAAPAQEQELKRQTTFLQRPDRPVPQGQSPATQQQSDEQYRVVIKKQPPKKSVAERLVERGLLDPSRVVLGSSRSSPQPPEVTTAASPAPETTRPQRSSSPAAAAAATTMSVQSVAARRPGGERRARLYRRPRYARRLLASLQQQQQGGLGSSGTREKPRLLRRPHYFERLVARSLQPGPTARPQQPDGLLRVLLLASLARGLRDAYDAYDSEVLHRGSSRRNSRRPSCGPAPSRRESLQPLESGLLAFDAARRRPSFLQTSCAEGRRRLSVVSLAIADKLSRAVRTDLARGVAYALVPAASALAFLLFTYSKRLGSQLQQTQATD